MDVRCRRKSDKPRLLRAHPSKRQGVLPPLVTTYRETQPATRVLLAVWNVYDIAVLRKFCVRNTRSHSRISKLPNSSGCCAAYVPCVRSPVQSSSFRRVANANSLFQCQDIIFQVAKRRIFSRQPLFPRIACEFLSWP